jgi:uncharacterized protein (DUF305 family)
MRTMMTRTLRSPAAACLAVFAAACSTARPAAPASVTPDAPAEAQSLPASAVRTDTPRVGYTEADVRFMQGMIGHHAQALAMTSLLPARTRRADMRLLAERIDVSQKDEIAFMQRWLAKRGEAVPSVEGGHEQHAGGAHPALMPGMLTEADLARLAAATGPEFDQLFLEYMIRHHEGALVMVKNLFATQRGGQEPELFKFAADVDADQAAEIKRMRGMLGSQNP